MEIATGRQVVAMALSMEDYCEIGMVAKRMAKKIEKVASELGLQIATVKKKVAKKVMGIKVSEMVSSIKMVVKKLAKTMEIEFPEQV